jgi:signal transduction histidine kinase
MTSKHSAAVARRPVRPRLDQGAHDASLQESPGSRESLTALLEFRTRQLRAMVSELAHAEQRERRRLAQVLHDHLQQLLVAARAKVALVGRLVADPEGRQILEDLDGLLDQSIAESRSLTVELSPPVLYEAGLAAALEWLAGQMQTKHGLRVEVDINGRAEHLSEETRVLLFAATRELLFNVVKHAQVDCARLELSGTPGVEVRIVVSDAGAGFDAPDQEGPVLSSGFGLFSIRERLELIGGRLEIEAAPGQGTRAVLVVPG